MRGTLLLTTLPADAVACNVFAGLYHQRWGVEETSKARLNGLRKVCKTPAAA
ncbi:MAG: hypothetical protein U1D29_02375 [Burkholderiales bacterium]|nr:hypothetical protein [Burkholderiales bacterium]